MRHIKQKDSRPQSISSNGNRGDSVDYNKYKPITRHAESHRQLGLPGGSRTNLFEQALSIQEVTR